MTTEQQPPALAVEPCPHCGPGESIVEPVKAEIGTRWQVYCGRCGSSSGSYATRDQAIVGWNRRATPTLPGAEGDEVSIDQCETDADLARYWHGQAMKARGVLGIIAEDEDGPDGEQRPKSFYTSLAIQALDRAAALRTPPLSDDAIEGRVDDVAQLIRAHSRTMGAGRLAEHIIAAIKSSPRDAEDSAGPSGEEVALLRTKADSAREWFTRAFRAEASIVELSEALQKIATGSIKGEPRNNADALAIVKGIAAEALERLDTLPALRAASSAEGWIVGNAEATKWRTWGVAGPEWTTDREMATRYARRIDAEQVHAEDEDAWRVAPYSARSAEGLSGRTFAGIPIEQHRDGVATYHPGDDA